MNEIISKQIITTPEGERLVVISEREFNKLLDAVEDKEDQDAVDQWQAQRATGQSDDIPLELMKKLADPSENKLKLWRKHRKLTGTELADMTGLSQAYISLLESGQREGTLQALKSIANALDIDLDDLA